MNIDPKVKRIVIANGSGKAWIKGLRQTAVSIHDMTSPMLSPWKEPEKAKTIYMTIF